jgi:hypothetical protein
MNREPWSALCARTGTHPSGPAGGRYGIRLVPWSRAAPRATVGATDVASHLPNHLGGGATQMNRSPLGHAPGLRVREGGRPRATACKAVPRRSAACSLALRVRLPAFLLRSGSRCSSPSRRELCHERVTARPVRSWGGRGFGDGCEDRMTAALGRLGRPDFETQGWRNRSGRGGLPRPDGRVKSRRAPDRASWPSRRQGSCVRALERCTGCGFEGGIRGCRQAG